MAVAAPSAPPPVVPARSVQALDWLNFFLADVQTGVGPFLAIYLAAYGWDEARVGVALTVGGLAGVVAQTPAGWLVDRVPWKRALVGGAVTLLALGALLVALRPTFGVVLFAQTLIGAVSSVFVPVVCAISLGIVGRRAFDARQGRNQMFNAAGNVATAVAMGLLGYFVSNRSVFFLVLALAVPTCAAVLSIRPDDIDQQRARGDDGGGQTTEPTAILGLLRDRRLALLLACSVLFHFANAAMLPLLGEMLAKGKTRGSMMFMSACVVTTQLVISLLASPIGRGAGKLGRKPLLLFGFAVLPVRGVLYTLTSNTVWLVAIQILDGVGAGIFGVVSVLMIADLTRGTGRFNLTVGAITAAVGAGASLSQTVAGSIVHRAGYHAGFLFLSAVAVVALVILGVFVPETRDAPAALQAAA